MRILKLLILLIFLAILLMVFFFRKEIVKTTAFLFNFLSPPAQNLLYSQGRTNVLFLGIGGGEHQGWDLTDTIIFVSLNIKNGDTVLLSIPRDIWSDNLKAKINTAYHYGLEKNQGLFLAKKEVEMIVGQPIHYVFLLDFQSFKKAIDLVGGIRVKVDRAFDDYYYPIAGRENDDCGGDPQYRCRYEHLHFDAGWQTMDGERALKFVRSRNAEGEEGTDFARSNRQQKVIAALKEKILSWQILTSPKKIKGLFEISQNYLKIEPPLTEAELAAFANLGLRLVRQQSVMRTLSLETGTEENPGFLINPPVSQIYGNQWVLIPRAGSWQEFQTYLKQKLNNGY